MMSRIHCFLIAMFIAGVTLAATPAADKGDEGNARPAGEEPTEAQQALRTYLQLQEQLHSAQLAIEQNRKEADTAARHTAELLTARLKNIEEQLTTQGEQRQREMESLRSSNRATLFLAAILAAMGVIAIVFTSLFQIRAMNRLAEIATAFSASHALGGVRAAGALAGDGPHLVTLSTAEQSSQRLLGAIERLEKRVHELEHTSHPPVAQEGHPPNGEDRGEETTGVSEQQERAERISLLLGKGQALLNLDQADNALACFDEVIVLDPDNAEALVKKGTALERLKKLEEAIECYDRAIAVNQSMTLAWLYKGGVFNQLERFSEALQCYEQALRTQQRTTAAQ